MIRYASRPSQRPRRLLNQEAAKRAHRRGALIRHLPAVSILTVALPADAAASAHEQRSGMS